MNFKKNQCVRIKRDVTPKMITSAILPRAFGNVKLYFGGISHTGRAAVNVSIAGLTNPWYIPIEYLEPYESISIEEKRKVDLGGYDVNDMVFEIRDYLPTPTYYVDSAPLYTVHVEENGRRHRWTVPASWFDKPACMFDRGTDV